MQVETPLNSIICTLWDLCNCNKKTFCNISKARIRTKFFILLYACEEGIFWAPEDSATHLRLLCFEIFMGLWLHCRNTSKRVWLLECCYTESIRELRSSLGLVEENMFLGLQPCCTDPLFKVCCRLSASLCQAGDLGMHQLKWHSSCLNVPEWLVRQ